MSDIKDKIKKLLKKAKDAGDHDMIELALHVMELLDEIPVPEPSFPSANQEFVEAKSKVNTSDFEEFSMNKVNDKISRPVEVKTRKNEFVDNGSEHKDVETPVVQLTERRRQPFKKVEQTCTSCNRTVEVHPQFARDFFKCDRCMRR